MISPYHFIAFEAARRSQQLRDEAAIERSLCRAAPSPSRLSSLGRLVRRATTFEVVPTAKLLPTLRDYPSRAAGR